MEATCVGLIFMGAGSLEYMARQCGDSKADSIGGDGVMGGYVMRKTKVR